MQWYSCSFGMELACPLIFWSFGPMVPVLYWFFVHQKAKGFSDSLILCFWFFGTRSAGWKQVFPSPALLQSLHPQQVVMIACSYMKVAHLIGKVFNFYYILQSTCLHGQWRVKWGQDKDSIRKEEKRWWINLSLHHKL